MRPHPCGPSTSTVPCGELTHVSIKLRSTSLHFTSNNSPCACSDTTRHPATSIYTQTKQSLPYSLSACLHKCFLCQLLPSVLHRLVSPRLHLGIEHWTQPPVTLVARHLTTTSLHSLHPRHRPHLRGGVKRRSLSHVATSPMHPHFSHGTFSISSTHFPTHSTANTSTSARSPDRLSDCSTLFHWSRRLAITCSSLQQRLFTNRDTRPLLFPRDSTKGVLPLQDLSTKFWTP
jgi:hypothetical protein